MKPSSMGYSATQRNNHQAGHTVCLHKLKSLVVSLAELEQRSDTV